MKLRRASFLVALMLVPAVAHAGRHRPDAFFAVPGISGLEGGSTLDAKQVSLSVPILPDEWDLNLVGDFSRYAESKPGVDRALFVYLAGLRFTFPKLLDLKLLRRAWCLPFAQFLIGGADNVVKGETVNFRHYSTALQGTVGVDIPAQGIVRLRGQFNLVNYAPVDKRRTSKGWSIGLSIGYSKHK